MGGYDFPDDGKSQSGAMFLIGNKGLEDVLQLILRNAASIIFDCNHQPFVVDVDFQCDFSTAGDGFHGILQKIQESLLQTDGIPIESGIGIFRLYDQRNMAA